MDNSSNTVQVVYRALIKQMVNFCFYSKLCQDLEEDSRETTMKYSPGARDGVFVVEVQQGVRRSPGTHNHPPASSSNDTDAERSDQCALVHNPPPDRYNK